jgi:CheY-like chemotaxis protein
MNYDKIETKSFSIEKKDVNLWTLLEKTISPLMLQAKEKNIQLELTSQLRQPSQFPEVDFPLQNLRLVGDSIKIGQVIRNLVSNALKFTPAQGDIKISGTVLLVSASMSHLRTVAFYRVNENPTSEHPKQPSHLFHSTKIHSSAFHDASCDQLNNGNIVIRVMDTGPGLSLEQLRKIFSEGVQFNPNQLQAGQGSGLGLWISREIVLLHGGQIRVTSPGLGCGATFEVMLPVTLRADLPSESVRVALFSLPHGDVIDDHNGKKEEKISTPIARAPKQLLVVDDAISNRKLVARILRSRGYLCDEAENGQDCLMKIMSGVKSYDAILMDYEMPILNGPLAAQKLREMKFDLPIIGLTGNVLPEDREYYLSQGANLVLTKPLQVQQLIDYLEHSPESIV